jgi:hypothetical protein
MERFEAQEYLNPKYETPNKSKSQKCETICKIGYQG